MKIHFTRHAREKFEVLARHGIDITEAKIIRTVRNPEYKDARNRYPLIIAQSALDSKRVLRVVYKIEKETIIVITFYPGRKSQYEK